tara:strand:+ start:17557 stop:18993 length:1437 start_codon:yes stop_codon:yes gene_type:complete
MKTKQLLFFFLVAFSTHVFAQKKIHGIVLDHNEKPLIGATIYLNNTTAWTTSDDKGEFELPIKNDSFDLIVTYLGYQPLLHIITSSSYGEKLIFKMTQRVNILNEVVVKAKKKISKTRERRYMQQFTESFLGMSRFAKDCVILNKDAIHFEYDQGTETLEAYATEPLIIRNNGLGYLISYDLTHFEKSPKGVTYLGYSRYKDLKGSTQTTKKWHKNRKIAYQGSLMHFTRSLVANNLKKEGFLVDVFKEVENSKRPHDSIIEKTIISLQSLVSPSGERFSIGGMNNKGKLYYAKNELDFIRKKNSFMNILNRANFSRARGRPHDSIIKKATISLQNLVSPDGERYSSEGVKIKLHHASTKADFNKRKNSYIAVLNKISLPKTKKKYLKNVSREEFTIHEKGFLNLSFRNYIKVRYMKEHEEEEYPYKGRRLDHQTSTIRLTVENAPIDAFGNIILPLHVVVYEHMGYEKLGDTLPLDY